MDAMRDSLVPFQLGYGAPRGAEAVAHSACQFLFSLPDDHVFLKLDFKNAFNSVRRDKMLYAIKEAAPTVFAFVHSTYSSPSLLHYGSTTIPSVEVVQQGDPVGLLAALAAPCSSDVLPYHPSFDSSPEFRVQSVSS